MKTSFVLLCAAACCAALPLLAQKKQPANPPTEPVIMTIGQTPVSVKEFQYLYEKNYANYQKNNGDPSYSEASLRQYLDLFVPFKLKVSEARAKGIDKQESFEKEYENYRKQLAKPYLTDRQVTERMVREAYDRMQTEVRAAHILVLVQPYAAPEDTLAAFQKIQALRKRITDSKEDFAKVAREASEDPSAKENNGDLGYFTGMQMIYAFEDMAYKVPIGEVSQPFRTRFGYHIVKVADRRPSRGTVRVAHIMIRSTEGMSPEDTLSAYQKIREIQSQLAENPNKWAELCRQFSDDQMSREQNGELPPFSAGGMIESFAEAALGMQKPDQISGLVRTPFGWHLIKLLERKTLEPFEKMEASLRQKVNADSRSEVSQRIFIDRLKKENGFEEFGKMVELAFSKFDTMLIHGKWQYATNDKDLDKVLFRIGQDKIVIRKFYDYVTGLQREQGQSTPKGYALQLYRDFVDTQILEYEERHLDRKHEQYRFLSQEYREGIMLFQIMEEEVWAKAVRDTSGLQQYFQANRDKYRWNDRARAVVLSAKDPETLAAAKKELDKKSYQIPVTLPKAEINIGDSILNVITRENLDKLASVMRANPDYQVTVQSHLGTGESAALHAIRLKSAVEYLEGVRIAAKRIRTEALTPEAPKPVVAPKTKGKAKAAPAVAVDTVKAQLTFVVSSESKKALEPIFNRDHALALKVSEGLFEKDKDKGLLDPSRWQTGEYEKQADGRYVYVRISEVLPSQSKNLDEVRGQVISDYQQVLETTWVESLRKKFEVKVNEDILRKLVK